MSDTSPHSPLDPSTPWDSASLRRLVSAVNEPTPVEGLVVAALLRQDAVTVTPEAAAELARVLYHAGLLLDGATGVQSLARLDAIRRLHQPVECDCADEDMCRVTHLLCRECCLDSDDDQSQDCVALHAHTQGQPICATVAILDADLDGAS